MDHDNFSGEEKLGKFKHMALEHLPHNLSPSRKIASPGWEQKNKQSAGRMCKWMVDHQLSISINLISTLFFTHILFSSARHYSQKFFQISYYNPSTGNFALGWDDINFVFYWILVFTGLRCATIDYILKPLAKFLGIEKRKQQVRFAEQAWILLYYTGSWCFGISLMYNSEYWLDLRALWRTWPDREMNGPAKWYYLVQFGFYLQQIVVVNIEERRKDHWQMFTHHIITCVLIFISYGYHQYRVGTVILCLMDFTDIILPLAKILKYLHLELLCDIAFSIFIASWLITRHILYSIIWYSIYAHIPQEVEYGCYKGNAENLEGPYSTPNDWDHLFQPFKNPVGLVCWDNNIKWGFLGMLGMLQVILLIWFGMIVRIAFKLLTGKGAEDSRSDDEDDQGKE